MPYFDTSLASDLAVQHTWTMPESLAWRQRLISICRVKLGNGRMKSLEDGMNCKYEEVPSLADVVPISVSPWDSSLIQSPYLSGKDNKEE